MTASKDRTRLNPDLLYSNGTVSCKIIHLKVRIHLTPVLHHYHGNHKAPGKVTAVVPTWYSGSAPALSRLRILAVSDHAFSDCSILPPDCTELTSELLLGRKGPEDRWRILLNSFPGLGMVVLSYLPPSICGQIGRAGLWTIF
jgi:hypothetical protein